MVAFGAEDLGDGVREPLLVKAAAEGCGRPGELGRTGGAVRPALVEHEHGRGNGWGGDRRGGHERAAGQVGVDHADVGLLPGNGGDRRAGVAALRGDEKADGRQSVDDGGANGVPASRDHNACPHWPQSGASGSPAPPRPLSASCQPLFQREIRCYLRSGFMSGFEFSILGPVEATVGDGALPLGGPRQRALLAYLLLHANKVVASDRLVDELWETPPGDAHAALQNQVSRLRKVLDDRLSTRPPGYVLRVDAGELDLDRFRAAVAAAGSTSDLAERSRCLREADALFHGSPLSGVEAPFAAGEAVALEELRLAALEARVDADLERGRHAELVPELGGLVARHPLRERLRGQHILALYRSGRQAEALEAYRDTRRTLDEQLGLEPSPALRDLERAILTQDPALAALPVAAVEPPMLPGEPPRRPRGVIVAFAAGAVVLMFAGGAAAVLLTQTDGAPRAKAAAAPDIAAHPVARQHAATRASRRSQAKPHVSPPTAAATTTVVIRVQPSVQVQSIGRAPTTPVTRPVVAKTPVATLPAKTTPAKAKQTHVTPPVTTTTVGPAAAPAGTAPAGTGTLADDFSESTPNTALWYLGGDGSGYTAALQNGRLIFTVPADAQTGGTYNMVGPSWSSQCRFEGDFDARVDYQLLDWPPAGGVHLQLASWIFPNTNSGVGRQINQYSDSYSGNVANGWDLMDTQDTQGTLRLARVGDVETAYYLAKGGGWVAVHSGKAAGETTLGLQLFGMANDWAHKQMRVALDNFSVVAVSVCR